MRLCSFVIFLLFWGLAPQRLTLPTCSFSALDSWGHFSVIPPVSNPRSRQNLEASKELEGFLLEVAGSKASLQAVESRWHFRLPWDATPKLESLRCPLSVRLVALDAYPSDGKKPWSAADADDLARWICAKVPWDKVHFARQALGALRCGSCHVCLRRRKGGSFEDGDGISLALRREVALQLEALHGWVPEVKRSNADLELHIMLGSNGRILLEVPLLVQRIGLLGGLQHPGMKQVEAWAVAKSLQIQTGDVVLDPMCGKGTLLAEAAIWWPQVHYIGCDVDESQLKACRENHRHLRVEVETHLADASREGGLPFPDHSMDKIMTAPPWDKQFEATGGLGSLYPAILREFDRVLRHNGTLALLLNLEGAQAIRPLLENWSTCQCRFAMTRHTVGVLLVARPGKLVDGRSLICSSWRTKDLRLLRGLWTKQRADERPRLRPANGKKWVSTRRHGGYVAMV